MCEPTVERLQGRRQHIISVLKRYQWPTIVFVAALGGIGIALTILFLTLDLERPVFRMMFDITVTLVSIGLVLLGMGLAVAQALRRELENFTEEAQKKLHMRIDSTERALIDQTESLQEALREGLAVELTETPDEIWDTSVRMLEDLATARRTGHAFDVSTYMNKIRYEETVTKVLENEIMFSRIFCFERASNAPADLALVWFFDAIVLGEEVSREDLEPFGIEIRRALKDRQKDKQMENISEDAFERLRGIIQKQRAAYVNGFLRMKQLDYHLHNDFVGISCIRPSLTGGEVGEVEQCEVLANFKTDSMGETYVAGLHGRGILALGYRDFFHNMLWG